MIKLLAYLIALVGFWGICYLALLHYPPDQQMLEQTFNVNTF